MRSFSEIEVVDTPSGELVLKIAGKTRMKFRDVSRFYQFIDHLMRVSGYQDTVAGHDKKEEAVGFRKIP